MNYSNSHNVKKQAGFSLIELSFVLVIFGLMISMFVPVYNLYITNKAEITTKQNTELMVGEITEFLAVNGHYPCPAPPAVSVDDPNYGRESDVCTTASVADAVCDTSFNTPRAGICVESSQYRDPSDPATEALIKRIIVGAVPFRQLNVAERNSYDGYSNKLIYAVTEVLTRDGEFKPELGGIRILDANNNDIAGDLAAGEPGIHFLVYSAGENNYGAYNSNGVQIACNFAGTDDEVINCAGPGKDAEFRLAERSTNFSNTNEYDDVFAYIRTDDIPYFKLAGNTDDIELMDARDNGKLGMMLSGGAQAEPEQELDVGANVRAKGDLQSNEVCTYGNEAECFEAALIAGDDENMECPTGEFVKKISQNKVVCAKEVTASCPLGYVMSGVSAQGEVECVTFQIEGGGDCAATSIDLCPDHPGEVEIPAGLEGDQYIANEKDSDGVVNRSQNFTCTAGSWQPNSAAYGTCECIPDEILETRVVSCGQCRSGTNTRVTMRECPSGKRVEKYINSTCTCDAGTECNAKRAAPCTPPEQLVGNERYEIRTFNCPASGVGGSFDGPWKLAPGSGACECVSKEAKKDTVACSQLDSTLTEKTPGRLIPTIQEYSCTSSSYGPKTLDNDLVPANVKNSALNSDKVKKEYCVCNSSIDPQTRNVACSSLYPGWTGVIKEKRDYSCDSQSWGDYYPDHASLDKSASAKKVKETFCTELASVVCKWQKGSSMGAPSSVFLGAEADSVCDCNMSDAQKIGNCHKPLPGNTKAQNYAGCYCG